MKTEQALQLAKELIAGPRAKTYGDKIQNHCNIAKLWTAYLDKEITAHDAAEELRITFFRVFDSSINPFLRLLSLIYKGFSSFDP